jgi:hypothetical protein
MPNDISQILYSTSDDADGVHVVVQDDTIWATQRGIAEIFGVKAKTISEHLANIYREGELEKESTNRKFRLVKNEGGKEVPRNLEHYNLDAIISIGYRVNSQKATKFRIWANGILKQYIKDGFVVDEARLREDPQKLNKLAAKIRELRADEKNVFASVRECFKLASSDYEPSSQEVRRFYSLLQDKFHHAVTKMTASKLKMDRANHIDANMGVVSIRGLLPTKQEIQVGKNYLKEDELYRLYLLSEQFLLYAESTALRGEDMTMHQLHDQLDKLLMLNGYPVFDGYKDWLKDEAREYVNREYELFIEKKKLEYLGVSVDLGLFYQGEYESYKDQTSQITIKQLNKAEEDRLLLEEKSKTSSFDEKLKTALSFNPKD